MYSSHMKALWIQDLWDKVWEFAFQYNSAGDFCALRESFSQTSDNWEGLLPWKGKKENGTQNHSIPSLTAISYTPETVLITSRPQWSPPSMPPFRRCTPVHLWRALPTPVFSTLTTHSSLRETLKSNRCLELSQTNQI